LPRQSSEGEAQVAREILNYFLRKPFAVDNLEGIARWRLMDESIHRSLEETRQALSWLVKHGLLIKEGTHLSEPLFRLDRKKLSQVRRFINRP